MLAHGYSFTADVQAVAAAASGAGFGLVGVAFLDTSASANTCSVYDGIDATGKLLATVTVAASSGTTVTFPHPLRATGGIFVDTTGACKGTVWVV